MNAFYRMIFLLVINFLSFSIHNAAFSSPTHEQIDTSKTLANKDCPAGFQLVSASHMNAHSDQSPGKKRTRHPESGSKSALNRIEKKINLGCRPAGEAATRALTFQ